MCSKTLPLSPLKKHFFFMIKTTQITIILCLLSNTVYLNKKFKMNKKKYKSEKPRCNEKIMAFLIPTKFRILPLVQAKNLSFRGSQVSHYQSVRSLSFHLSPARFTTDQGMFPNPGSLPKRFPHKLFIFWLLSSKM